LIITYYTVIIGWVISYIWYSFGTQWGDDTNAFFFERYLGLTDGFWTVGGIQFKVLFVTVIAWAVIYSSSGGV
jgi:NSS family neurotransmitter:Na+ symporter